MCQYSDALTDPESNLAMIIGERKTNHVELQLVISPEFFGIIPALVNYVCAYMEAIVNPLGLTKVLSQALGNGLLNSKATGQRAFSLPLKRT